MIKPLLTIVAILLAAGGVTHARVVRSESDPIALPVALSALRFVAAPGSATASGLPGQVAYDGNYFYFCPATNTWKRSTGAAW